MFYRYEHSMSISPISHMAIFVYLPMVLLDVEIVIIEPNDVETIGLQSSQVP